MRCQLLLALLEQVNHVKHRPASQHTIYEVDRKQSDDEYVQHRKVGVIMIRQRNLSEKSDNQQDKPKHTAQDQQTQAFNQPINCFDFGEFIR